MSVCLVTVVSGRVYECFAEKLFESAERLFRPTENVRLVRLAGVPGWPEATMMRPRILRDWLVSQEATDCDYAFLVDADARIEELVGPEILPNKNGITATLHPGYVGKPPNELPYERDRSSICSILDGRGKHYFCGGFIGGSRGALSAFMTASTELIASDLANDHTPLWHDESALNRLLADAPPAKILSPAYCFPDDDSRYRTWWPERYQRKIVMLDKSPEERASRGS